MYSREARGANILSQFSALNDGKFERRWIENNALLGQNCTIPIDRV